MTNNPPCRLRRDQRQPVVVSEARSAEYATLTLLPPCTFAARAFTGPSTGIAVTREGSRAREVQNKSLNPETGGLNRVS
jgi:hypothetical protein